MPYKHILENGHFVERENRHKTLYINCEGCGANSFKVMVQDYCNGEYVITLKCKICGENRIMKFKK